MTDGELETWAERAAIREYDGKMPRQLAEKLAHQDVLEIIKQRAVFELKLRLDHQVLAPQPVAPNAPTNR